MSTISIVTLLKNVKLQTVNPTFDTVFAFVKRLTDWEASVSAKPHSLSYHLCLSDAGRLPAVAH